MQIELSW